MSIAVFASGSGSNFEKLVAASRKQNWHIPISVLICDKPGAKVIERAKRLGIPFYVFPPKEYEHKVAFEQDILEVLKRYHVSWIVLAGYMRLIGTTLLTAYPRKIVNLHPSLLPAFPGLDAIGQAYRHPVKVTGVTVHYVDEGLDTGPIIAQEAVKIEEKDTLETLTEKIHQVEHQLYPKVVYQLIQTSHNNC